MIATCPCEQTLVNYGLGKMGDSASEGVALHVAACEGCRRRVAELPADSFVAQFRAGRTPEEISGGPSGVPAELLALPQYTVLRELGRGGMGVVYLAKNSDMGRLEVLKVVQPPRAGDAGRVAARFVAEAQAAARLQHPNVVAAYHLLRAGETLVFVMEYAPGRSLAEVVRDGGPLPVGAACSHAVEAAQGLQHAHERGTVHRDIKPGNLILTHADGRPTVKVLDFGLAKFTAEGEPAADRTGDGQMMGTPDYMAPEQSLDAARADIRADVYALGCTLYCLLAGRPPFAGANPYAVIDQHRFAPAEPLDRVRPAVPAALAAVVARMMAKDPDDRYATPAAAAADLRPFAGFTDDAPAAAAGERPEDAETPGPERTAPDRPAPRPRPAPRRPRWVGRGLACALAVAALAAVWQAGVLVRLRTATGTVVLDDVPDGAEVALDGDAVTVTRDGDAVTLRAVKVGPHKLRVTRGGKDLLAQGDVVVTLGGQPVRVRVEPPAPEPPVAPPPPAPAAAPAPAPADRLVAGSVWAGTRTYTKGPWALVTVPFELHVVSRDGAKFRGHVFDNGTGRNECKVEGELAGVALTWTELPVHAPDLVCKTSGTLDGATVRVSQRRERGGKPFDEAYAVLKLVEVSKATRKGDPVAPAEPPPR